MFSIHEIKQIKSECNINEVNNLLDNGWVLLNTYTYCTGESLNDYSIVYVLGSIEPA